MSLSTEHRVGLEIGWRADPLPLFEIQDRLHSLSGAPGVNLASHLAGAPLVFFGARRRWRIHWPGTEGPDVQAAPFVQTALGTREVSLRTGIDILTGGALAGRRWDADPAIGAGHPRQRAGPGRGALGGLRGRGRRLCRP